LLAATEKEVIEESLAMKAKDGFFGLSGAASQV